MLPVSSELLLGELARWTFGLSASFHFCFVPLSIGLLLCINLLQTADAMRPHPWLARAATFWSRFFLLVWATGILTGYPLRSRLADSWGGYLTEAQPVFKAVFEIEGAILWPMIGLVMAVTVARSWLSSRTLAVLGWALLGIMAVQSFTILSINAWMQVPSMLPYVDGIWQVPSLQALLLHPTTWHKAWHTLSAALLCGTFFLFAGSVLLLRKGGDGGVATVSLGAAAWVGLFAAGSVMLSGHHSASGVAQTQPMKFAAFEGHWRAEHGPAPLVVWGVPDETRGLNEDELSIPYLMSVLRDGTLNNPPGMLDLTQQLASGALDSSANNAHTMRRGLKVLANVLARELGPQWQAMSPEAQAWALAKAARPPVKPVFFAFRAMVFSGVVCALLCVMAFVQRKALREGRRPWLMLALLFAAPLAWVGTLSGWVVAEVGRQPWTIYGHLPTAAAHLQGAHSGGIMGLLQAIAAGVAISLAFAGCARSIWRTPPGHPHWMDLRHILRACTYGLRRLR
jgi:cytochrome bd ubiquinol oxidase subunit I